MQRKGLRAGETLRGPAVIAEAESTTFVPPGFSARLVEGGHILMQREKS